MTTTDANQIAPQPTIAPTQSAALAERTSVELAHLARFDPDRLTELDAELQALASVLFPQEPATAVEAPAVVAEPPVDIMHAPSLRHGVHLASYRIEDNAVSGWRELVSTHSQLASLEARLERRNIAGRGEFLRLKAGPFDARADAAELCASLLDHDIYCMPVDFSGRTLAE